jgi:hypothetical protein
MMSFFTPKAPPTTTTPSSESAPVPLGTTPDAAANYDKVPILLHVNYPTALRSDLFTAFLSLSCAYLTVVALALLSETEGFEEILRSLRSLSYSGLPLATLHCTCLSLAYSQPPCTEGIIDADKVHFSDERVKEYQLISTTAALRFGHLFLPPEMQSEPPLLPTNPAALDAILTISSLGLEMFSKLPMAAIRLYCRYVPNIAKSVRM